MERINLIKYGFIRDKSLDFNDDGNRFTCFRVSEGSHMYVSKCVGFGEVYLSANNDNGNLPYEIYSALPNYKKATWDYNGVSINRLTDKDLKEFYEACVAYEKEYKDMEASIVYPSLDELKKQCEKIQAKILAEINELDAFLGKGSLEIASKFTDYDWTTLKRHVERLIQDFNHVDPNTYPQFLLGKSASLTFMKEDNPELVNPTYWYKEIKELLAKYKII